jgi:hypothetical protein
MKDITIEIDGLRGNEADGDYVRALMAAMFHPSVTVISVIMELGDGYSWGPTDGRATVKVGFKLDENPVLKFLSERCHD